MAFDPHADTHAEDEQSTPRTIIGQRYELVALLGSGGMGNVYKARDLELDELVALKVLRPEIAASPGSTERFRREVKLARRVTHPVHTPPNIRPLFPVPVRASTRLRALYSQLEAEAAATTNDIDATVEHIETSVACGLFDIAWLDRCPLFEELRQDPRFAELRRHVDDRAAAVRAAAAE